MIQKQETSLRQKEGVMERVKTIKKKLDKNVQ